MKQLIKLCEKDQREPLFKTQGCREQLPLIQSQFKADKLNLPIKSDLEFFYAQFLYRCILSKQAFETVFFKACYEMNDYWSSLNYLEKKRLINIEIDALKAALPYVMRNHKQVFIPMFDERMNDIYRDEMVLFELKQYAQLRYEYASLITQKSLSADVIAAGFTELELIGEAEEQCFCFCKLNHRLYVLSNGQASYSLSLSQCAEPSELAELLPYLIQADERGALQLILSRQWLSEKALRKGEKLLSKWQR
ncbi:hypothetical protein [Dielma fastidiosa]|uniref:Uncharacterized protein n=1 Tax=Dielma fastidiosa TaxID=1034346 RepID=A0A318KM09_9FIRM|nr:hypothetical protein [Dielma fastidiosa]PXX76895.1 hypothetical protein DES51_11390 [Dielma fastidiosa]